VGFDGLQAWKGEQSYGRGIAVLDGIHDYQSDNLDTHTDSQFRVLANTI